MINDAIRAVIDLLKLRKDAKKTDLEIEKLEREKSKGESVIQVASFADVHKYDPKTRQIEKIARKQINLLTLREARRKMRRVSWLLALLLFVVIVIIAFALYRFIT